MSQLYSTFLRWPVKFIYPDGTGKARQNLAESLFLVKAGRYGE